MATRTVAGSGSRSSKEAGGRVGPDVNMCSDGDKEHDKVNPLQLEPLFLWRSTKLLLNSNWHKVGVGVEFVK